MTFLDRNFSTLRPLLIGAQLSILIWCSSVAVVFAVEKLTDGSGLGLQMIGAIVQKKNQNNVALIKHKKTGRVEAVRVGFKISDDYRVTKVSNKYLIVQKGKDKHLVFQSKFASEFKDKKVANYVADAPPAVAGPQVGKQSEYREEGFSRVGGEVQISEAYQRNKISGSLSKIMMQATALPKMEKGRIVGFQLTQIDASSIFDKLGLLNNDIIQKVNGIELRSVPQAIKTLKSLKGSKKVEIELVRDNRPEKIAVSVLGH